MKLGSSAVALAVGGVFGAATSLTNDVSSPYGSIGSRMADAGWAWAAEIAEVASLLVGQGWAWAGLAVAVGWMAGAGVRGALAAALALLAATTSYYGMDSVLREVPLAWYWGEISLWWFASVVLGPALGAVGASIGRPGVIGLLAGLTVPFGATVQMILLPPSDPFAVNPAATWARVIVWVAAAACAGVVIARFGARLRPSSRAGSGHE